MIQGCCMSQILKQTLIAIISLQFIFSPMTMAQNTKPIQIKSHAQYQFKKEHLDGYIKAAGLNKNNLTAGEFFKNVSKFLPKEASDQFKPWFEKNKNIQMPKLNVSAFKDNDGQTRYRITLTKDKEVRTLTVYGQEDNFIQYNNMPISMSDIFNINSVALKIFAVDKSARDPRVEEQINYRAQTWTPVVKDKNEYNGSFQLPTYESYKKMTPYQRAEMIVRTYDVWMASKKAQYLLSQKNEKKSAANTNTFYLHQFFISSLLGELAEAKKEILGGRTFYSSAKGECIDSGYVGEFKKGSNSSFTCVSRADSYKVKDKQYAPNCVSICNPMIYGLDTNGAAYCSDNRSKRQIATHWEGPCDTQSRLSTQLIVADLEVNPNELNLDNEASYEKLLLKFKDHEGDIKNRTRTLLESLMNENTLGKNIDENQFKKFFEGKASEPEFTDRFVKSLNSFNNEISRALNACSSFEFDDDVLKKANVTSKDDGSQQLNACRQLWRRKLAFDVGVGQICKTLDKSAPGACQNVAVTPAPPADNECENGQMVESEDSAPVSTPAPKPSETIRDSINKKFEQPLASTPVATPKVTVKCKCPGRDGGVDTYNPRGKKCGGSLSSEVDRIFGSEQERNMIEKQCPGVAIGELVLPETVCICSSSKSSPVRQSNGKYSCSGGFTDDDTDLECLKFTGLSNSIKCHPKLWAMGGTLLVVGGALWWLKSRDDAKDKETDVCPTGWQTCPGQYGYNGNTCPAPTTWSVTLNKCYLPCGPNEVANLTTNPTKCDPVSVVVNKQTSFNCWNGQTVAHEMLCPNYTCPNGSKVPSPALCPASQKQMQKSIFDIDK